MSADMLRYTGETTNPTITFSALPMSYPSVRNDPDVYEVSSDTRLQPPVLLGKSMLPLD